MNRRLVAAMTSGLAVGALAATAVVVSIPAEATPVPSAAIIVEQQAGNDTADRLDAAIARWKAAPTGAKPAIVFTPNIVIDLSQRDTDSGKPYQLEDGMHFQCLTSIGREFRSNCKVRVQGGEALFQLKPGGKVQTRDISMVGIEWDGSTSTHFIKPSSALNDMGEILSTQTSPTPDGPASTPSCRSGF